MTERDKKLIQHLKHFRVLSRDQIGKLICPTSVRPHVIVNRVAKRLSRDGWLLAIPQAREEQYIYMPNPAMINMQSPKLKHFLGLVDVFLTLGQPEIYEVEPQVTEDYRPDAYTRIEGVPTIIELQRSTISTKKMQLKVDLFIQAYKLKKHDARRLLVYTDITYRLNVPSGFEVIQEKLVIWLASF